MFWGRLSFLLFIYVLLLLALASFCYAYDADITNMVLEDDDISILNEIDLIPASTQVVNCTADVFDSDNISKFNAVTSTLYHSTSSSSEADSPEKHYSIICDVTLTNSNGQEGFINCSYDMMFYSLPGEWFCNISINDSVGSSVYSLDGANVTELLALNVVESSIAFDALAIGGNSAESDYPITIQNNGNVPFDIAINTFGLTLNDQKSMNCTTSSLKVSDLRYSQISSTHYNIKTNAVSNNGVGSILSSFNISAQVYGSSPIEKLLYFGMGIESTETAHGNCQGNIMLTSISN